MWAYGSFSIYDTENNIPAVNPIVYMKPLEMDEIVPNITFIFSAEDNNVEYLVPVFINDVTAVSENISNSTYYLRTNIGNNIHILSNDNTGAELNIFNEQGKLLLNNQINSDYRLDISCWPNALYVVIIKNSEGVLLKEKFIKTNMSFINENNTISYVELKSNFDVSAHYQVWAKCDGYHSTDSVTALLEEGENEEDVLYLVSDTVWGYGEVNVFSAYENWSPQISGADIYFKPVEMENSVVHDTFEFVSQYYYPVEFNVPVFHYLEDDSKQNPTFDYNAEYKVWADIMGYHAYDTLSVSLHEAENGELETILLFPDTLYAMGNLLVVDENTGEPATVQFTRLIPESMEQILADEEFLYWGGDFHYFVPAYIFDYNSKSKEPQEFIAQYWCKMEGNYIEDDSVLIELHDWTNEDIIIPIHTHPPTVINFKVNSYQLFNNDSYENVLVALTDLETMEIIDSTRTDAYGEAVFYDIGQDNDFRLTLTHEDTKTWEIDFESPATTTVYDTITLDTVVSMIPKEIYSSLNEVMVEPTAADIDEMFEAFNIQHSLYGSLNMYVEPTGWDGEWEPEFVTNKLIEMFTHAGINLNFTDYDFFYPINNSPDQGYDPYTTDPDIVGTKVSKGPSTCSSPDYLMPTGEYVRVGSHIHTNGNDIPSIQKEGGRMWGFTEVVSRSSCMNPDPNEFNDIDNVIFTITDNLGKKRYFDLQHELNDMSDLRDAPYWGGKSSTDSKSKVTPVTDFTKVNADNYWKMN